MDIPIRLDDDGAVLVGSPPAAPAGSGVVGLRGAEVFVDPTAPDPPHLVVHDIDEAEHALELLHGPDVAAAAVRVADGAGGEDRVPVETGPVAAAVRTMALVRWLEAHSPDLLPAGLLDLEFGTAAATVGDLLAEPEEAEGERRLVRHAGLVTQLARRLRDGDPPPPAGLAALIGAAVPAMHAVLPFDSPHLDDLVHEEELARALTALGVGGARLDWTELATLPAIGGRSLAAARHAGASVREERVTSVDWYQVPRGLLDTAEDTVSWSLTTGGEPSVAVSVRAAAGARAADRLAFRLYSAGMPLPIAIGRLRLSADGSVFTGTAPVLGPAQDPLTLDVHDALDTRLPQLGMDRTTAQAVRWMARAVTALRLGGPSTTADGTARGAIQEAARLFRRIGAKHPRAAPQELARRRQARCFALLRTVLLRSGEDREAAQLAQRWGSPTGTIHEIDVALPDLAGPGWAALAAENALAADIAWELR